VLARQLLFAGCPEIKFRVIQQCTNRETAMNWDRIEGNWKQFKGNVKQQWGDLTDDQIELIAGKRDQLVGQIQEQYGLNREETERQLRQFEKRYNEWTPETFS
jgi:uncharacterized protein YjbJ (UPF0337 family)